VHDIVASGKPAVIINLDFSAAFDSISHDILLCRLEFYFGVVGVANQWFRSYLTGRTQLLAAPCSSRIASCSSRVPQGSVLGPVLFLLYGSHIARTLSTFDVRHHVYADDLNIVSAFSADIGALTLSVQATSAVHDWYTANDLLLNPDKSEVLITGTGPQLHQPITITIAEIELKCKENVTLLGVKIDSGLSMDQFISYKVKSSNYHLRAFGKIRPVLSRQVTESVGRSIILSQLDYCNSLLAGATSGSLSRLQRIQNQVARSVVCLPRPTHAQPTLTSLHWLPVRQPISHKLAVIHRIM